MAASAKAGEFLSTTGTSDVVVTGVGFQPKALIVWLSGTLDGAQNTNARTDYRWGAGFAAGVSDQRTLFCQADHGSDPDSRDTGHRADACLATLDTVGALTGRLSLTSFDADGFTLQVDDALPSNHIISYLALGGTDLTHAVTGSAVEPGTIGTQTVSGLALGGNAPSVVFFLASHLTTMPPAISGGLLWCFGCAVSATKQWLVAGCMKDASTAQGWGINGGSYCVTLADPANAAANVTNGHALYGGGVANGFDLDWDAVVGGRIVHYLAIAGGSWVLGSLSTTTPGNVAVTGFGGQPTGLLLAGAGMIPATAGNGASGLFGLNLSLGAASGPASRTAQAISDRDAVTPVIAYRGHRNDAALHAIKQDTTGSTRYLLDLVSFDADGLTYVMDLVGTLTPAARFVAVTDGTPPPPPPPPAGKTRIGVYG